MKPQVLIVLAISLLIAADTKEEKAAKKDLKKMEGAWVEWHSLKP